MCVIISIVFVSCSNNTPNKNEKSLQDTNQVVSAQEEDNTFSDKATETSAKSSNGSEKKFEKFYVNYNGFKMDVDFDEKDITEILDAKESSTVPDVKMKMSLAELIAVYDGDSEDVFGTLYIGEDDCCYLQFADSKVEGAAFKMPDSAFVNEMF